jgi:hypothetical protein
MVETEDPDIFLLFSPWSPKFNSERSLASNIKKMVNGEEGTVAEISGALWVPQFKIEKTKYKVNAVKTEGENKLWSHCKMVASERALEGEIEWPFDCEKDVILGSKFIISILFPIRLMDFWQAGIMIGDLFSRFELPFVSCVISSENFV